MFWALGILAGLGVAAMAGFVILQRLAETPDYALVHAEGAFEIRDYPALSVAEIRRDGDRREALRTGFGPLAGYIFARDRDGERIAMTAPVLQEPVGDAWAVRFIMPAALDRDALPEPQQADLHLGRLPPMRLAAVRFSGRPTDARLAEREQALRDWLEGRALAPAGPAHFAYYSDPMTPGFLQRTEVLIPLVAPGRVTAGEPEAATRPGAAE